MTASRLRFWVLLLLPLFAARTLVPAGFMLAANHGALSIVLCSGVGPIMPGEFTAQAHHHPGAHGDMAHADADAAATHGGMAHADAGAAAAHGDMAHADADAAAAHGAASGHAGHHMGVALDHGAGDHSHHSGAHDASLCPFALAAMAGVTGLVSPAAEFFAAYHFTPEPRLAQLFSSPRTGLQRIRGPPRA